MSTPSTVHIPTVTLERFESFRSAHGPIESPLEDRIHSTFFNRAIGTAFRAKRMAFGGAMGGWRPIQISIQVDARGAAPGIEQNIKWAALGLVPEIERELDRRTASNARRRF